MKRAPLIALAGRMPCLRLTTVQSGRNRPADGTPLGVVTTVLPNAHRGIVRPGPGASPRAIATQWARNSSRHERGSAQTGDGRRREAQQGLPNDLRVIVWHETPDSKPPPQEGSARRQQTLHGSAGQFQRAQSA